jgi:HPt (histidine-containing phosphotransfer) domain-containing protein
LSLDVESVIGDFEGKEDIFYGAVDRFLESVRGQIVGMRKAAEEGAGARIAEDAHSIKGAARFIAAEQMAVLALELEQLGKSGKLDDAQELMDRMILETNHSPDGSSGRGSTDQYYRPGKPGPAVPEARVPNFVCPLPVVVFRVHTLSALSGTAVRAGAHNGSGQLLKVRRRVTAPRWVSLADKPCGRESGKVGRCEKLMVCKRAHTTAPRCTI